MAYIVNDKLMIVPKEGKCLNVKGRKNAVTPAVCLAGMAALFLLLLSVRKELQTSEASFRDVIKQNVAEEIGEALYQHFVPVFSFVRQGQEESNWLLEKQITGIFPLYGYYRENRDNALLTGEAARESYLSLEDILLAEAQEGSAGLEDTDTLDGSLQDLLKEENDAALLSSMETAELTAEQVQGTEKQAPGFVPHTQQNVVDLQELGNYEMLVKNFYTIDGNTMAGSEQLDVTKFLEKDMTISKESEGPQILIYHTHSQESFSDSIPGDAGTSIVGVGEYLTQLLTEKYGYNVLHHTGQYDVEARDDAYSKALPAIEQVLAENPSIQVVIDLHRDEMAEETRLVMDLDGRPTARFMFFNGLSWTRKTGSIAYLYNENLNDNLAFSFQMQLAAAEYYPGLTRKIYLKGYRYNMHLRPRTLLIELGAQNNTVEEAMNACDPLAHILDIVLSGEN